MFFLALFSFVYLIEKCTYILRTEKPMLSVTFAKLTCHILQVDITYFYDISATVTDILS